jgi:hypothetical protein
MADEVDDQNDNYEEKVNDLLFTFFYLIFYYCVGEFFFRSSMLV